MENTKLNLLKEKKEKIEKMVDEYNSEIQSFYTEAVDEFGEECLLNDKALEKVGLLEVPEDLYLMGGSEDDEGGY